MLLLKKSSFNGLEGSIHKDLALNLSKSFEFYEYEEKLSLLPLRNPHGKASKE